MIQGFALDAHDELGYQRQNDVLISLPRSICIAVFSTDVKLNTLYLPLVHLRNAPLLKASSTSKSG